MKTKKVSKKLSLNKTTIAALDNSDLNSVRGAGTSEYAGCPPPTTTTLILPNCITLDCTHLPDCKLETIVDCPE